MLLSNGVAVICCFQKESLFGADFLLDLKVRVTWEDGARAWQRRVATERRSPGGEREVFLSSLLSGRLIYDWTGKLPFSGCISVTDIQTLKLQSRRLVSKPKKIIKLKPFPWWIFFQHKLCYWSDSLPSWHHCLTCCVKKNKLFFPCVFLRWMNNKDLPSVRSHRDEMFFISVNLKFWLTRLNAHEWSDR